MWILFTGWLFCWGQVSSVGIKQFKWLVEVFLQYNFSTNPHNSFENIFERTLNWTRSIWISSVFPLKNLPFSMTSSDPSERRRKVDTRWSSAMAAKLERSRPCRHAMAEHIVTSLDVQNAVIFSCQWAKSHGIFPTHMTIQVVPSSLEQTQWVHRPQTGCILAPWPTGGSQAPESGRSGSQDAFCGAQLLVKTWTVKLASGKLLHNYSKSPCK